MSRRIRLGESLVADGLITADQLDEALARTKASGERIGEALVALRYISERDLVRTLARDADVPFLEASELQVDPAVLSLIEAETAIKERLIPIRADGGALLVAMSNPFDIGVIRTLERATGRKVRPVTGDPAAIAQLIESRYSARRRSASAARPLWRSTKSPAADARPDTDPTADDAEPVWLSPSETPAARAGARGASSGVPSIRRADSAARRRGGRGHRTFSALIDQDSVELLEYSEESGGFRIVAATSLGRRFASPEAAVDALLEMLREAGARRASITVVLQHFGSVFKAMAAPAQADAALADSIQRELIRSGASGDLSITYSVDAASPDGVADLRNIYVGAAPVALIRSLSTKLAKANVRFDGLTVVPEAFRHLYATTDGSSETTALLICRRNGPHVAFFVGGRLEMSIEPAFAVDNDKPLDTRAILDQIDRSAVFLRQQARGAVATRLLLSAPAGIFDDLASRIEAHTGMRVSPLGAATNSPDTAIAMGGVIAMRAATGLDLLPPRKSSPGIPGATSGGLIAAAMATAAAVAGLWAGIQITELRRDRLELEAIQSALERSIPALEQTRRATDAVALASDIRAVTRNADGETAALLEAFQVIADSASRSGELDSVRVMRVEHGIDAAAFGGRAPGGRLASLLAPLKR